METQHCDFSEPLTAFGDTPTSTYESFNFSKVDCTGASDFFEMMTTTDSSTTYFIHDRTISSGDFIVIAFLLLFLVLFIFKSFADFSIPKKLDWKKH